MTATLPLNRVAPFLYAPKAHRPLPATREAREQALADGVFAALGTLQALLTNSDPDVVMKAAAMLLDFEKTRLRHGRPVAGTADELPTFDPLDGYRSPDADRSEPGVPSPNPFAEINDDLKEEEEETEADEFVRFLESVRIRLQSIQDKKGTGLTVSRKYAERVARALRDPEARRQAGIDPPYG